MRPRPAAERGFTLVEVMIALLIFGMIAAAGVALLSFSVRAQAATAVRLEEATALARLSSALAGDLAQAVDRPSRDEAGTLRPAFVGEPGASAGPFLQVVRAGWENLDGAPRPGLQKVWWRWNAGAIERVAYPQVDGAAPLPAAVLFENVARVTLRYRFVGAWSDRWDGATPGAALPQAVDLTIVREDGVTFRQLLLVGSQFAPRRTQPSA